MADENKKKNEYSVEYGGSFFDDFADFDSASNTESRLTQAEPEAESREDDTKADKSEKKSDKSPIFAILCAVIVLAIVSCSALSAFRINGFMTSSAELSGDSADKGAYNAYTEYIAKYNETVYPSGINQRLTKAYAANNDVVGLLYIKGTNINTPVVQAKDNDYYVRMNFYGINTHYGTTFADYRCKVGELSKNTVIFGHNMPSGTHFYDVNRYEDIEWYRQHPVINYSTLYGDYTFLVYTAFYTTADPKDDGGYLFNYIYPNMSDSNFKGFIEQVDQRALYKTDVDLKPSDKIINVSTCNHTYDQQCGQKVDSRLVVIGRLLRSGESDNVNTDVAKENPNYRRPQVWYDKKGKTNPYANSRSWKPASN